MASINKNADMKIGNVSAPAASNSVSGAVLAETKTAEKGTAKKTAEIKTAAAKTTDKKAAAKKPVKKAAASSAASKKTTAKSSVKAAPEAEKKTPAKKAPKAKGITMNDVVTMARTKANAANTTKITKKIAATINLTGTVQGDFYILLDTPGIISVEPYKYDDADIALWGTTDDITAVLTNKIKLIDAISSGKIGLWGNAEKAVIFVDAIF